jgi:flagellar biosynthetic protein FlhB
MKRVFFSSRSVVELLKGFLKISVLGGIAFSVIRSHLDDIMGVVLLPFDKVAGLMSDISFEIITKVGGLFVVIAVGDFMYQK